MKAGRIQGMSFAFDVLDQRKLSNGVTELLELEILEAGPATIPANPDARVLTVKSHRLAPAAPTAPPRINEDLFRMIDGLDDDEETPEQKRQIDALLNDVAMEPVRRALKRADDVQGEQEMWRRVQALQAITWDDEFARAKEAEDRRRVEQEAAWAMKDREAEEREAADTSRRQAAKEDTIHVYQP
jgi:Caudovirus prohead serine protease